MKSKFALQVLSCVFLAWITVGSISGQQTNLLNKILGSATPDTFAECSNGNVYSPAFCNVYTNSLTVDENPTSPNHSGILTFRYNNPSSSFSQTPPSPIVLNLNPNLAQCSVSSPSITFPATTSSSVSVTVTALNDGITETPLHSCVIGYTATFSAATPVGNGYVFTPPTVTVGVTDYTNPPTFQTNFMIPPVISERNNVPDNIKSMNITSSLLTGTINTNGVVMIIDSDITQCRVSLSPTGPFDLNTIGTYYPISFPISLPASTMIYIKATPDNIIETPLQNLCELSVSYSTSDLNNVGTTTNPVYQNIQIADYTPGFEAQSPDKLFEKPTNQTLESNTGEIKLKLLDKPSDNLPVKAIFTNLSQDICESVGFELMFDQSNYDTIQTIPVRAIKDNIYQPEVRKCNFKVNFTSASPVQIQSDLTDSPLPNSRFMNLRSKALLSAVEYDGISYVLSINVLDRDIPSLAKTGFSQRILLFVSIVTLIVSTLTLSYRLFRTQKITTESLKVRL
jgi:hypothetical protein